MKLSQNAALLPITRDGMGSLSLVLTWDANNLVLIDAGIPGQTGDIAKLIENEGFSINNLTHIIITHQDWDHIGCITDIQKLAPAVKIIAHTQEAPYIDGRKIPIKLAERLEQYNTMTEEQQAGVDRWKNMYENSPIQITEEVTDGQIFPICGGIEVVHTPGHTPGHITLYLKESRIMVCGDATIARDGKLTGPNPVFTQDMELAIASFEKIKSYDLEGVVAYHGGYIKTEV